MFRTSILAALLSLPANAAPPDVTVYFASKGATVTFAAQKIADSVFQKAGITVAWETRTPPRTALPGISMRVDLAEDTPAEYLPGALAVAYPYACTRRITVFTDRVRALAPRPDLESALLGYVLAHEITHVLQGLERHSEEGVMKAGWSIIDRTKIFSRQLTLLDEDTLLMRQGMAAGCAQPVTLTGRSESGIAVRPD
jgi:hypothetical protein